MWYVDFWPDKKDGLEVMLNVPKKANDALHLSLLEGCDLRSEELGEVVLQDTLQVWDPKQILRKSRERHCFLFELYLVFSKEVKDSQGKAKYLYKNKLMTSELGVTEHIEGDECKFAVWTGRAPISDYRIVLKASSLESKQAWVKKLREVIQETYFSTALPLSLPKSPAKLKGSSQRSSRDLEDTGSLDESVENLDRGSLASFGSGNTTDSDKAGGVEMTWVISDHVAAANGQLSVTKGQQVEVVEQQSGGEWALVRLPSSGLDPPPEGLVPLSCLKQPPHGLKPSPVSPSRRLHPDHEIDPGPSDGNVVTTNSPVNKRRVFMGRKWLPPPLRKLSAAKVEKNQTPERPPLKKVPSDKRFKSPTSESKPAEDTSGQNGDEADEEVLELPPPMKPISDPLLVPSEDAQAQREQHSEKTSQLTPVKSPPEPPPPVDSEESALQKRKYVIQELIDTERDYVRDLRLVVEGYMDLMRDPECPVPMPEDLRGGKEKMVFGNLEAIFEWHRDSFLKALERCLDHPEELGPLFKRYERKLLMYVIYCGNKPLSERIVTDHDSYFEELRQKLGHKLQLCDLLIKPVQRIMKYQLLLRDVYKYTERARLSSEMETLRQAIVVMQVVPKTANDMMDFGRLQGFDGKAAAQGKLLLHGTLQCSEGTSTTNFKGKDLVVFLFEQNVIFSEAVGRKTQFTNPVYIYKAHIQVNKMSLDEGNPSRDKEEGAIDPFIVRSTDPKKPGVSYACVALTPELHTEWLTHLRAILQTQRDFLKAIQSPIAYQKELTKEPTFGFREPSPPLPHDECPEVFVSQSHCKRQSLLGGFRATLRRARSEVPQRNPGHARRWSDSPHASQ